MPASDKDDEVKRRNHASCPTVESMDVIGTPWRLNVIRDLLEGEKRFNEIKRSTGASSRTLSQTLETLEEHDVVAVRREIEAPVAVYYRLTEKGAALEPVFDELDEWAETWMDGDWPAGA